MTVIYKTFIVGFFILESIVVIAQCEDQHIMDDDLKIAVLMDEVEWNCFNYPELSQWFNQEYLNYQIDTSTLNRIKHLESNYTIRIYFATWCPDTRRELPRMKKILDYLNEAQNVELIGLNRKKKLSGGNTPIDSITHVPSMLVFLENKEIGRISEKPQTSLETDLFEILKR
jgi:hypothetical protein